MTSSKHTWRQRRLPPPTRPSVAGPECDGIIWEQNECGGRVSWDVVRNGREGCAHRFVVVCACVYTCMCMCGLHARERKGDERLEIGR